jgi:eukaryotic-like serine/threonine-protein kinase
VKTAVQPAARAARERDDRAAVELVLDRYRLREKLGSGGFGTVWRAHDERLGREVAVKRIPRAAVKADGGGIDDRRRAAREALAAARLNHRGIVALYEAGADDDAYYIVSELVDGEPLSALFEREELTDGEVARIGAELADALEHAHARGIVHRDVKPQNVVISDAGPAKLTDFGVARIAGSAPLTHTGDVVGTLAYMAPEQSEGRQVGPAADLYSLALVVYEGLAGFNPVRRDTPAATARALGRPVPPLRRSRRDLPDELCDAIDRALIADPQRRCSLGELRSALLDSAAELEAAGPRRASPRAPRRFARPLSLPRHERTLAAAGAGLLAVAGLAWLGPDPPLSPLWGLAAALAVAVVPRAGWIAMAVTGVCWLAIEGQPGAALLVAIALAAVPLALPRAPALWSLPALAPALGVIGLAPAFPAVAAQVAGARRRTALAVAGLWWLLLGEALFSRRLLLGVAAGTRSRRSWQGSVPDTITHALAPLVRSGALTLVLVWAGAAVALPWLLRGRSASFDLLFAAAWALLGAAATAELASALRSYPVAFDPLWLVAGSIAACALAVVARGVRGRTATLTPD